MAEQVFRSPGFFPREIDVAFKVSAPTGIPAGVIGTAKKGPAFTPVLISSFKDFVNKFGTIDGTSFAPYAVKEFLKNAGSCVFVRVLGAGANKTQGDINTTDSDGTVRNAGFSALRGTAVTHDGVINPVGGTFFLAATHSEGDATNFPLLTEAGVSVNDTSNALFIRAMIFAEQATNITVGAYDQSYSTVVTGTSAEVDGDDLFKIYISSSADSTAFAEDDGIAGLRVYTASLNPNNTHYIKNVLNTDINELDSARHVLWASFDLDDEVASVSGKRVSVVSGTSTNNSNGTAFGDAYGTFKTRYTTPTTPYILSQPFGVKEYDLFKVESISDGEWANNKLKVTIANLKKSISHERAYGTFTLLVRDFDDSDESPIVLESYPNLDLDPNSANFVGRRIGDQKLKFDFDQVDENERRVRVEGKYPNVSKLIRVVLSAELEDDLVPNDALPCGFRGYELLKTTTNERDSGGTSRLAGGKSEHDHGPWILPPILMRRKLTKNQIGSNKERADKRLNWGVQFSRVSGSATRPNRSSKSSGMSAYAKFLGIRDFDMLITGSSADTFNNNKFTLDKVNTRVGTTANLTTSSINDVVKDFLYERDKGFTHKSLVDILMEPPDSNGNIDVTFNRFSSIAQFNLFMYGGFDGVDLTSKDETRINDKASSTATGGRATSGFSNSTLGANQSGTDLDNASIQSYRRAIEAVSNPDSVDINILTIPGIREPLVTDYASDKMKDRFDTFYVMDVENFDKDDNRLFDDRTVKPEVKSTIDQFLTRGLNNNFAATYFPDIVIKDNDTGRRVTVPPTVVVLGALAFNDKVGQPWFAPAGFNRGGIENAKDIDVRLDFNDRNVLYDASINPISRFPREGVVVLGQKTLQVAQSALNRVSVRRLLIEVRRAVKNVGNRILFEPHRQSTINKFKSLVNPILERIQIQAGIDRFKVVIDETTTSVEDINNNTLRGKVFIVPTKTAEHIAVDFIVTEAGVQFE
tara:strand:- start:5654 stop:8596 length:2943 start_codon:yes stop_codon:yes gene_type:complete